MKNEAVSRYVDKSKIYSPYSQSTLYLYLHLNFFFSDMEATPLIKTALFFGALQVCQFVWVCMHMQLTMFSAFLDVSLDLTLRVK